jgi:hypothetical protein
VDAYNLWSAVGKPRSGHIFNNYHAARREYRSAVRKCQRDSAAIYTNELHDNLMKKDHSGFWKSWRSKFNTRDLPRHINGTNDSRRICDLFKDHLSEGGKANEPKQIPIYNTGFSSRLETYEGFALLHEEYCNPNIIHKVIFNSPRGRAPWLDNITIEHLQYAHPCLPSILSKLFTMMIVSGHVPNSFKDSYTVPIPKTKDTYSKSLTVKDFRGVAISSQIGKIFERCLLLIFDDYIKTSDCQMGFKKSLGCRSAIYSLQQIANSLCKRGCTANICTLDISKAFDRVNHVTLLNKLMDCHLPKPLVVLLARWLPSCNTCVRWDQYHSDMFILERGVRQGSVLAPFLFIFYVDNLLSIADNLPQTYILMYADDIVIITGLVTRLQHMLTCVEIELLKLSLTLNPNKTYCIRVGKRHSVPLMPVCTLEGCSIPWVTEIIYLGITFHSGQLLRADLHRSKLTFFRSINSVMAKVGATASEEVLIHLLATKCIPSLLYSTESLTLLDKDIRSLDYCVTRCLIKNFRCSNMYIIRECIWYFEFDLPSVQVPKRRDTFLEHSRASTNSILRFAVHIDNIM